MTLFEWLSPWVNHLEKYNYLVTDIIDDTRQLKEGNVFFALSNDHYSQTYLISEAIKKKPKAIIFSAESNTSTFYVQDDVLLIPIVNLSHIFFDMVARYFQYPVKHIHLYGVTGTNGKTSCTHFISQCLNYLGVSTGVIGTLGYGKLNQLQFFGMTTPNVLMLQRIFSDCLRQNIRAIAMEVSSHAIHQNRIEGLYFKSGIFTNLTRDHLDYHGTMVQYEHEKKRFISWEKTQNAIINADDSYGLKWIYALHSIKPVFAYTLQSNLFIPSNIPTVRANILKTNSNGTIIQLNSPWGDEEFNIPLIGKFNISNALAVFTALCADGYDWHQVIQALVQLRGVPGRMQTITYPENNIPWVVVDYAHTPDALEKILTALRPYVRGKLICIFGCGGNRDSGKRPLMAKVAEQCADEIIVTSDNPRFEDPQVIISDIAAGFSSHFLKKISSMIDRRQAIISAISHATQDDLILIAGKGAENYQDIQGEKIPFSDAEIVRGFIKNL